MKGRQVPEKYFSILIFKFHLIWIQVIFARLNFVWNVKGVFYYWKFWWWCWYLHHLFIPSILGTSGGASKLKLATIVEGDPKAPFRYLLHQGVGEGATPFPGLLHFTLDPYLIMLSVKQGGIKYLFFLVFGMTRPGIEPRSPRPLANTRSMSGDVMVSKLDDLVGWLVVCSVLRCINPFRVI